MTLSLGEAFTFCFTQCLCASNEAKGTFSICCEIPQRVLLSPNAELVSCPLDAATTGIPQYNLSLPIRTPFIFPDALPVSDSHMYLFLDVLSTSFLHLPGTVCSAHLLSIVLQGMHKCVGIHFMEHTLPKWSLQVLLVCCPSASR